MVVFKHKHVPKVLVLGCLFALFLAQLILSASAAAQTDPNCTSTSHGTIGAINCENQQTTTPQAGDLAPGCYLGNGTTKTPCPTDPAHVIPNFDANKCYRAPASSQGVGDFAPSSCTPPAGYNADSLTCASNDDGYCNFVKDYINPGIQFLAVLVGLIVTIMIIVGGIQYSAAGADPNAVAKAKKRIFNAIFALVAFGLLYAFLQYIIPGGLL